MKKYKKNIQEIKGTSWYGWKDGKSVNQQEEMDDNQFFQIVKRIVSSGRPLFKFPDFARKAVMEKYPDCPENWDAAADSPFWETVKKVRKEVLSSK